MYECEKLFGPTRGRQVHELVEAATNAECPCKSGRQCPILAGVERGPAPTLILPMPA